MSHVVIGEGRLGQTSDDLAAIRLACEHLGLVFQEGKKHYQWFGRWMKDYHGQDAAYRFMDAENFGHNAKHVIRLACSPYEEENYAKHPEQRPYEVGLVEMPDGKLAVVFDNWSGGKGVADLIEKIGPQGGKLVQKINQFKIVAQVAKQKGHSIKSIEPLPNGATKIVIASQQRAKF